MRGTKLNKTEVATLKKAYAILCQLSDSAESAGDSELFNTTMNAIAAICDIAFIHEDRHGTSFWG